MEGRHTLSQINQQCIPRLRRNRKIEQLWGMRYHSAVKETVFGLRTTPHVPTDPLPHSLRDVVDSDPLYVCKQCNDCFRIKSSYEDHCTRRSWILGYWCQYCFLTICTHRSPGSIGHCVPCSRIEHHKRNYLRTKSDKKKMSKLGATRVFYNQCQFFSHLNAHKLSLVDMGDIMLMPFPYNVQNEHIPELEKLCEALMEHTFLLRVHIMDWLKAEKVENNWWQAVTNGTDENLKAVTEVLRKYQGRDLFKTVPGVVVERANINSGNLKKTSADIEIINDKPNEKPFFNNCDNDQNILEHEDNPCTATDIAFVDCGPTPKYFTTESLPAVQESKNKDISIEQYLAELGGSPVLPATHETHPKFRVKSFAPNDWTNSTVSYGSTIITPNFNPVIRTSKVTDPIATNLQKNATPSTGFSKAKKSIKVAPEKTINKIFPPKEDGTINLPTLLPTTIKKKFKICRKVPSSVKQNYHSATANVNSKIVTFQSSKHVDINTIIKQLPQHIINSKKIVFIGQDPEGVSVHGQKNMFAAQGGREVASGSNHGKIIKTISTKVVPLHSSAMLNNGNTKGMEKTQPKDAQKTSENKVVCQNGKNYIVKSVPDTLKISKRDLAGSINVSKVIKPVRKIMPKSTAIPKQNTTIPTSNSCVISSGVSVKTTASLQNDFSFPTPSPSPSESSSSSNYEIQSKQTSSSNVRVEDKEEPSSCPDDQSIQSSLFNNDESMFDMEENDVLSNNSQAFANRRSQHAAKILSLRKNDDGQDYLDVNVTNETTNIVTDESLVIPRCRDDMIRDFSNLSSRELRERIQHFEQLREEYPKFFNFLNEDVKKKNAKAIDTLINILKKIEHCQEDVPDDSDDNETETLLLDWESELEKSPNKPVCEHCKKIIKLPTYVPGFSKSATNENLYCTCYRHVCNECGTYEGKYTHFIAHQNYHKKEKPFVCPDCSKLFRSYKYLEAHTWTTCYHVLKKRVFGCKVCQVDGFIDMESLSRHFVLMHGCKKLVCEKCHIVLPSYTGYKKHVSETHNLSYNYNPIRLVVCKIGDCVVSYQNYIAHLEEHICVKKVIWFKCPLCPFYCLATKRNLARLAPHIHVKHSSKLSELISSEALSMMDKQTTMCYKLNIKLSSDSPSNSRVKGDENYKDHDSLVIPKIVNARTISSEVFELGTNSVDETSRDILKKFNAKNAAESVLRVSRDTSGVITSAAADSSSHNDSDGADVLPKILSVKSMAVFTQNNNEALQEDSQTMILREDNEEESDRMLNEFTGEFELRSEEKLVSSGSVESDKIGKVTVAAFSKISFGSDPGSPSEKISPADDVEVCVFANSVNRTDSVESSVDDAVPMMCESIEEASCSSIESHLPSLAKPDCINSVSSSANCQLHPDDEKMEVKDTKESNEEDSKARVDIFNIHHDVSSVLKTREPPPLARIPQYFLDRSRSELQRDAEMKNEEWMTVESSDNCQRSSSRPVRIALNGPTTSGNSENYLCHLCGELTNTSWSVVKEHFNAKHAQECMLSIVTPKLLRLSPDFINGGYKDLCVSKKRKSDGSSSPTKRRRRWTPKKLADAKNTTGLGLCVKKETAEDSEGNFICKKCNERCTDIKDLREHIASSHRIKGRYLVCLECGENFVVAPSLQMHLKAFHGIDDPITYLTQNTAYAPDITNDLETGGKATVANQCHVCMAVFEDKATVDKHLRVHGMAFLNRKRIEARNALKSPDRGTSAEKDKPVSKTIQDKSSPIKDSQKESSNAVESILDKISAII